jgi:hypothetical protein
MRITSTGVMMPDEPIDNHRSEPSPHERHENRRVADAAKYILARVDELVAAGKCRDRDHGGLCVSWSVITTLSLLPKPLLVRAANLMVADGLLRWTMGEVQGGRGPVAALRRTGRLGRTG